MGFNFSFSGKLRALTLLLFLLILANAQAGWREHKPKHSKKDIKVSEKKVMDWIRKQPVEFLENKGQIRDTKNNPVPDVLFKAETPDLDLYVTTRGLTYVFKEFKEEESEHDEISKKRSEPVQRGEKIQVRYERIDMELPGARIGNINVVKEDSGSASFNYLASPAEKSIYHVKKYRKITVRNIYPGIDWVLYSSGKSGFKYDFVVHPGAQPDQIELVYKSRHEPYLDDAGNLRIKTRKSFLQENFPYCYFSESKQKVESRFKLLSATKKSGLFESHLRFELFRSLPDKQQVLIIDPQLVWGTFFGGSGTIDGTFAVDVDSQGNIVACGYTSSTDFPLSSTGNFFQTVASTCFIVKFDNQGALLWSTYYGNSANANFVAIDGNDNIFVVGETTNTIPLQNAGTYFQGSLNGVFDSYISKFTSSGALLWSTLYGGSGYDYGSCVATDVSGNVYLTGVTTSTDFPLQNANSYFESTNTGFSTSVGPWCGYIVKFDNSGNSLWSTYLKGFDNTMLTTNLSGEVYVLGKASHPIPLMNPGGSAYYQPVISGQTDAAILKFSAGGNLLWGSYYGGNYYDWAGGCICDKVGNLFITGTTTSTNLPLFNAGTFFQNNLYGTFEDLFVAKFDSNASLTWATYLGGSRSEMQPNVDNLALDTCSNLYVTCTTTSHNIPLQSACDGGYFDNVLDTLVNVNNESVYLARFSNTGNLLWSSYVGGEAFSFRNSLACDKSGNTFITGEWGGQITDSYTYPIVAQSPASYTSTYIYGDDCYFVKFINSPPFPTSFSYTGGYCANDTAHLPLKAPGFFGGGTFSAPQGLSINPQTGQVTPGLSTVGIYTVSYMYAPCLCPSAPAAMLCTATVSIKTSSISVVGNSVICHGQVASFTASGATTYTWANGPATASYSFTPANLATVNLTVSGSANGCIATKTIQLQVSECLGIDELSKTTLAIYPNPNSGEFSIISDADRHLTLVNELGQFIRAIDLNSKNERTVNIQDLPKGIYFLKDSGKQGFNYKIVVAQ